MPEKIEFRRPNFRCRVLGYLGKCGVLIRLGLCLPSLALAAPITPLTRQISKETALTIGGVNAVVSYAGAAPGEINGLVQMNASIPQSVAPDSAVPITIKIGNTVSPNGTIIAVQ
jgi:uncharacterized protein (TIGR03437 family)